MLLFKSFTIINFWLGNMWAQGWGNIAELATPYPGKTSIDVTPEMLKQVYSFEKI